MTIKYSIGGIGMDVKRKLSNGESIPVMTPITGPAKKPASKTGICIGKNVLPAEGPPIKWNTCGNRTARAKNKPPDAIFLVVNFCRILTPLII